MISDVQGYMNNNYRRF